MHKNTNKINRNPNPTPSFFGGTRPWSQWTYLIAYLVRRYNLKGTPEYPSVLERIRTPALYHDGPERQPSAGLLMGSRRTEQDWERPSKTERDRTRPRKTDSHTEVTADSTMIVSHRCTLAVPLWSMLEGGVMVVVVVERLFSISWAINRSSVERIGAE